MGTLEFSHVVPLNSTAHSQVLLRIQAPPFKQGGEQDTPGGTGGETVNVYINTHSHSHSHSYIMCT